MPQAEAAGAIRWEKFSLGFFVRLCIGRTSYDEELARPSQISCRRTTMDGNDCIARILEEAFAGKGRN